MSTEDKHICLLAFSKGKWLRVFAEAEEIHDALIRERYLSRIPAEIERFGSSDNPLLAVFRMDVLGAELHSPGDKVEDITGKGN